MTHDLLVGGYSVQQVGFDPDANGGIGGAYIKHVDNRTVMFDPLCSDLQDSRAVFKFTHHTRDWFMQHYPKQAAELREDGFMLDTATDEIISPAFSKSILLIECWLREYDSKAGKHRVHMVKLAGGMKLEDSRRVKKRAISHTANIRLLSQRFLNAKEAASVTVLLTCSARHRFIPISSIKS